MSTNLKTIQGVKETNLKTDIILTRFWGGSDRGSMMQISLPNDYIALTRNQTIELIKTLQYYVDTYLEKPIT